MFTLDLFFKSIYFKINVLKIPPEFISAKLNRKTKKQMTISIFLTDILKQQNLDFTNRTTSNNLVF